MITIIAEKVIGVGPPCIRHTIGQKRLW